MNKINIMLYTFTLAVLVHHDTENILFIVAGFLFASVFGYWKCRILPTKKHMMFFIYPVILGLLLKLVF